MTNSQSNKLNMYNSVAAYLRANQSVLDTIPAFENITLSFEAKIKEIVEMEAIREHISSGKTMDKQKERNELLSFLLKVISGLNIYAVITGNNEIKQATDYTESDLKQGLRDNELLEKGYAIYNTAKNLITELADYGIAEADIEAIKTNADEFAEAMGIKGAAFAESKQTTSTFKDLFIQADDILYSKLDKLASVLKMVNEQFYNGFKNARQIIDR
ncbi:MAG: hypothetical protein KKF62_06365 [Bacteroidetes bacterium]|nr:hypothetical protein [Bacteroidota bacterium]MBU1113768.1 hypothetical protein [Bacteroidota bacterium]MBU1797952.1 hypothetical protein [Bacteroidota bacterium]